MTWQAPTGHAHPRVAAFETPVHLLQHAIAIAVTGAVAIATFAAATAAAGAAATATVATMPFNETQDQGINEMRGFILHRLTST